MKPDHIKNRIKESGNVLFLILIAVALFAALSYAVTQSTRSSGGSTGEVELISSAQITQYPASIRTSLIRQVINGIDITSVLFNSPSDFSNLNSNVLKNQGLFYPTGGGAVYQTAPSDLLIAGTDDDAGDGIWHFNNNFEVPQIGLTGVNGSADLIAFLPGISYGVCRRINEKLGIGDTAPLFGTDVEDAGGTTGYESTIMTGTTTIPTTVDTYNTGAADHTFPAVFNGQPFGCFENGTTAGSGEYVYYPVIYEN